MGGSDLGPTWYAWGTLPVWCDGALREMCSRHWRSPNPGGWVGAAMEGFPEVGSHLGEGWVACGTGGHRV